MDSKRLLLVLFVGLMSVWPLQTNGDAQTQEKPIVQIPKPGVPENLTMEAKFVRAAYNNEAYVILGYQASNLLHRRRMDAPRGRHHGARQHAGLQVDPRGPVSRDT
jgi:hypothetical protein